MDVMAANSRQSAITTDTNASSISGSSQRFVLNAALDLHQLYLLQETINLKDRSVGNMDAMDGALQNMPNFFDTNAGC
jgi:hypothetical protein